MTFLELLSMIAGAAALVASFMEGKKAGTFGILIGVIVGLGLGCGSFWEVRLTTQRAVQHIKRYGPKLQLILGWMCLLASILWIGTSMPIASWLTRSVIHILAVGGGHAG